MLRFSPLKTWLCFSTKQAWEADGSRSSRRVDDAKVNEELMGCQMRAMVVTMAWVASNGGVDGWRRWWTGVFDTGGTDVDVLCPQQ